MNWIINGSAFAQGICKPKSFFVEDFSTRMLRSLDSCVNDALNMGQALLPIHIFSPGGDAFVLNASIAVLEKAKINGLQIATIISGTAASAGALLFAMGSPNLRFMSENSSIMFHMPSISDAGGKLSEVKSLILAMEKTEKPLLEIVSKNLGKKKDWLEKKLLSRKGIDWYLDSHEALQEGICTHIHSPTFNLELTPHFSIS